MSWNLTYTTFTASDAERITGVSPVHQRDWRRHGFLPPLDRAKAAFDGQLLAGMLAAKALNDAGVAPAAGWALARSCGALIWARALNSGRGVFDPLGLIKEPLVKMAGEPPRFVVSSGDARSWDWVHSPVDIAAHLGVASIVIDLDRAADQLAQRARKPLVVIEAAERK